MKLFTSCLFFLFLFQLQAQNFRHFMTESEFQLKDEYHYRQNQKEKETLKTNSVKMRTTDKFQGKKKSKVVETYDRFGNILSYNYFNHKGENTTSIAYTYDDKNRLIYYHANYGKKSGWERIEYDLGGDLYRSRGYNVKGEYIGREIFSRSDGKTLANSVYRKDSLTPYKRLDYEYYDDGSLKSVRYFFKSELKYTWSYDCKPSGELVDSKQKDTTLICVKTEHDNQGNRIVWRQEINSKGHPIKYKLVYDKDSALTLMEYFDRDNNLLNQTTFFKDGGQLSFRYDKKGNLTSTYETIYNLNKQLIRVSNTSNRWHYNHWYAYQGNLISTSTYMSDKAVIVSEYSYVFYE